MSTLRSRGSITKTPTQHISSRLARLRPHLESVGANGPMTKSLVTLMTPSGHQEVAGLGPDKLGGSVTLPME